MSDTLNITWTTTFKSSKKKKEKKKESTTLKSDTLDEIGWRLQM